MANTYTFQVRTTPLDPNEESNFAGLGRDGDHAPISAFNGVQTQDNTTSPITSPVTTSASSVTTINIPPNAATITITAKSFSVLFSEAIANASLTSWTTNFAEIPVGTTQTFGVVKQSVLYLLGGTGAAVVSFYFGII